MDNLNNININTNSGNWLDKKVHYLFLDGIPRKVCMKNFKNLFFLSTGTQLPLLGNSCSREFPSEPPPILNAAPDALEKSPLLRR